MYIYHFGIILSINKKKKKMDEFFSGSKVMRNRIDKWWSRNDKTFSDTYVVSISKWPNLYGRIFRNELHDRHELGAWPNTWRFHVDHVRLPVCVVSSAQKGKYQFLKKMYNLSFHFANFRCYCSFRRYYPANSTMEYNFWFPFIFWYFFFFYITD